MPSLSGKKVVCLVTGSSQGIGRATVSAIAEKVGHGSLIILHSRSAERLHGLEEEVRRLGKGLHVAGCTWDLRKPNEEEYRKDLVRVVEGSKERAESFNVAVVIHNAAQLGDCGKKVSQFSDPHELHDQLNINLVSLLVLNSVFLHVFQKASTKIVVNLTAPSATNPRPAFGMTSLVKSSRQITLSILAKEDPDIKVLHYDPGAVDTESLAAIRDTAHDPKIQSWIQGFYDKGEVVTADKVGHHLADTLDKNEFESAAYVPYQ